MVGYGVGLLVGYGLWRRQLRILKEAMNQRLAVIETRGRRVHKARRTGGATTPRTSRWQELN